MSEKKPNSKDTIRPTRPHAIVFTKPSLTRGSFKDECDVNNIVRRYAQTGMVNHVPRGTPQYGDAPEMDFAEAMRVRAEIQSAEEEAALRPSETPPEDPATEKVAEVEKAAVSGAQAPSEATEEGD